jgi:hypothetical protein
MYECMKIYAPVLLHFVLMIQKYPVSAQIKPKIFLQMFAVEDQFIFLPSASVFCMFSCCPECNICSKSVLFGIDASSIYKNTNHQQMYKESFIINRNTLLHVSTLLDHLQGELFVIVTLKLRSLWSGLQAGTAESSRLQK